MASKEIDEIFEKFEKMGIKTITLVDSKNSSSTLTLTKDELKTYLGIFDDIDERYPFGNIFRF